MDTHKALAKRNHKKAKSAEEKGKRYRCTICRKRSPRKVKEVPYYCPNCINHKNDDSIERDKVREARDKKKRR